jgi:hypothetical protein
VNPGHIRHTHNLVYKKRHCDWIHNWNNGLARSMYESNQIVEKLIATATMKQRYLLGFPTVNDLYWTRSLWEAVKRRYHHVQGGFHHIEAFEIALLQRFQNEEEKRREEQEITTISMALDDYDI